ncbi:HNH endonuclease signature motif containing protein [Streptomyces sp. BE20]|uniref:HNH endonuclease signature motif containing protein n=1 Tax=unclassified Streptomyces TaxID=2593676 RepID=UPI002E781D94|nr:MULTISPECIES: HNH endonuclease signature motif containing protein [unclassified Streptomyces]MED7954733.1 HNH endonuclease signature motif containing protein [Streptomyces sp. BE303]MEE1827465.1 HNH endonuclease signature motif containing protein [Streptomyces sp. BE20]
MPVTRYTRELLTDLAATAASLDEMLIALGKEPNKDRRKYLRLKLTEFDVDTSHFRPAGSVYTRELLEEAVAVSQSVAGVVRHLHLRQAGGTQAHIGRRIRALGIDTSHFTGQAHHRGRRSPARIPPEQLLVQRPREAKRLPGSRIRLALAELGRPESCTGCGTGPVWQGRPLTLEVDHINGDWSDNRPENLRLLCPNCHAVTDTYCGRNKNRRERPAAHRDRDGIPPGNVAVPALDKPLD